MEQLDASVLRLLQAAWCGVTTHQDRRYPGPAFVHGRYRQQPAVITAQSKICQHQIRAVIRDLLQRLQGARGFYAETAEFFQ